MKIVIATSNQNKVKEIKKIFSPIKDLEIISLSDLENSPEIIEDGSTFEENAMKKAYMISKFTDLPVIADDSGLEIDALNGEPGVYSARYGGKNLTDHQRNQLVLEKMKGHDNRKARFVCAISILIPDEKKHTLRGECSGIILDEIRGKNGFGYDPIFFLPEKGMTMAEISMEEKNRISHRAKALEKAKKIIMEMRFE